jgi:hypothetical protein
VGGQTAGHCVQVMFQTWQVVGVSTDGGDSRRQVVATEPGEHLALSCRCSSSVRLSGWRVSQPVTCRTVGGAGALDGFQRARVDLLRGDVAFASDLLGHAPALLLKAATSKTVEVARLP